MATEDWFDSPTDFLPSADLIEQWQTEPESRPVTLTVEVMLQWLADLYEDKTTLTELLNQANNNCAHLRKRVHELEESMRNAELYETWCELAKTDFPD